MSWLVLGDLNLMVLMKVLQRHQPELLAHGTEPWPHPWLCAPASAICLLCAHGAVTKATANPRAALQPREDFHCRF